MRENSRQILDLLLLYQCIELQLFIGLNMTANQISGEGHLDEKTLHNLNTYLNKKTLGKLTRQYEEFYPNDDLDLRDDLRVLTGQRNEFMHIFAATQTFNPGGKGSFLSVLEGYLKTAERTFEKLQHLPPRE